jgi:N-ethylmaleimide reductase
MEEVMKLFTPVRLGALELQNRMVMAPLTRRRAGADGVPSPSARLYYEQRAEAGLIVSEGTCISPEGVGDRRLPGLWSDEQIAAWREITRAVHYRGGRIVAQLWHTGRASHPRLQPGGAPAVAPSAIAIEKDRELDGEMIPSAVPRALETEEIPRVVADYARAARNAISAGFDGVELHGANGYLIDEFLQDGTNRRTDRYGGSIENRIRFLR